MLEKIIDCFRKPRIFKLAQKLGCDVDGDVIMYKGVKYVIHILSGTLIRVK